MREKAYEKYNEKFELRTGTVASPGKSASGTIDCKKDLHRHFDPKHCKKQASYLAKVIWSKLLDRKYKPIPAILFQVEKPDGTFRGITEFSIPDTALANVIHRAIRDRNARNLSPMSFAYVPNRNLFDAILQLKQFPWKDEFFSVEIDFKSYFDSIPHEYLRSKLNDKSQFQITSIERYVLEKFMNHEYASTEDYPKAKFQKRDKGVPQGSSVSLFLANVANHDLDVELMKQPGRFARFADDVVALCSTHSDASTIEACFYEHCDVSGLEINKKKSKGIVKISIKNQSQAYFDYLGYRFSPAGLTLPQKTIRRMKTRISRLINIYLLQYLKKDFSKSRVSTRRSSFDLDLLGLISELRWSIYGGIKESEIGAFIRDGKKLSKVKGNMGFYCLLDDPKCLQQLDGWMVSRIRIAMRKRNEKLMNAYGCACPTPSAEELINGKWFSRRMRRKISHELEVEMPSFVRGWKAARKHALTYGLDNVAPPTQNSRVDAGKLIDFSSWRFIVNYLEH